MRPDIGAALEWSGAWVWGPSGRIFGLSLPAGAKAFRARRRILSLIISKAMLADDKHVGDKSIRHQIEAGRQALPSLLD
ncbi:hypothetical protein DPM33_23330 [Mesorhizobium hawassense]|uniref:Uncharacterized protein n=1 Tax=Mesorhizobium hawassense TaxID=1209954 RepID=A0A330HJM2_9HYPH|nr:hypothetical protein DPM33_23330 [Mesorhizobium hawassense]